MDNLYHYSPKSNRANILKYGLLSRAYLEKSKITYHSLSNKISKNLANKKKLSNYVSLTEFPDSKQLYVMKNRTKQDIDIYEIDPRIIKIKNTLFTNKNSLRSDVKFYKKQHFYEKIPSKEKEVLIYKDIPKKYIKLVNIEQSIFYNIDNDYEDTISTHYEQTTLRENRKLQDKIYNFELNNINNLSKEITTNIENIPFEEIENYTDESLINYIYSEIKNYRKNLRTDTDDDCLKKINKYLNERTIVIEKYALNERLKKITHFNETKFKNPFNKNPENNFCSNKNSTRDDLFMILFIIFLLYFIIF